MTDDSRQLFAIITHLVTSAPTSLDETPILAAFRMVDAAGRLMALSAPDDEFLRAAHADLTDHATLVLTDQAAFREWLDEYVRRFTREALSRTASAS
nr:DUF6092 family protein [Kibdelosporangium sp. MJ126-NF4]CEL21521.1 hypothetical protein [Kibdelosporangium sp. MJ126-NF4]CTQ95912.1 hypothetical protein [Kibdelosporangium sp. MJ126-NF4]